MKKKTIDTDEPQNEATAGFGGILSGLGGVLEKLNELAKTGEELRRTGNFQSASGTKGIYGVTVRVGLGDDTPHIESFGNIRQDQKTGQATVQEIREPVIDVFDEKSHVLIVAEMPGISAGDVELEVKEDLLTISATKGEKKYRKEILLPGTFKKENISISCNNGVLEIKCLK
jgi:HSP20 family protein